MKTVKPFIDLGFYVVPMEGLITRPEGGGRKNIPAFKGSWKELYYETPYNPEKYKKPIALTGAFITGIKSGAVSIDCDNKITYDIFKSLDPDYDFEFKSLGKTEDESGCSIIYRLTDELAKIDKFSIKGIGDLNLDFQTDGALQFLPTSGNKTKHEWKAETLEDMPILKEPPDTVVSFLKTLSELKKRNRALNEKGDLTKAAMDQHYKSLAPFCTDFLSKGKFAPELFRILTPKEGGYRELPQYVRDKTLHPNNVPEGMGNDYITRVAGVLVCDDSIDSKLFKKMIFTINNMWDKPYNAKDIEEIARYQLSRSEWVYDENWANKVSIIVTDYGTMVTVFYDPTTRTYYALDNKMGMSVFNTIDALPKHLNSIVQGGRTYKTADVYTYLEKKKTIMSALEPFGSLEPSSKELMLNRYNLFSRSKQYDVLLDPKNYDKEFKDKIPKVTIKFFEHLIPDEETRDYVLRFILTKLTTLDFSEVILYFLGKQGAGKNLFVDWLSAFTANAEKNINGQDYQLVVEVDLENFLSKYNLWIVNALFANLDEYGEKTSSAAQDRQVLANLKSFTGKKQIQLRTMGSDPVPSEHKCTFILTANVNRLAPDLEDRRLVLIDSPVPLAQAEFVLQYGGKSAAIDALFKEQSLWAYYLATNYKPLSKDEYRTPPDTEFKQELIMRHLPPSAKIAAIVNKKDASKLIDLCEEHDLLQELIEGGKIGIVTKNLLKELFRCMTKGTNARTTMLDNSLREVGLKADRCRIGKIQYYCFEFDTLFDWATKHIINDGVILNALN